MENLVANAANNACRGEKLTKELGISDEHSENME